jgi:hypothetical protein
MNKLQMISEVKEIFKPNNKNHMQLVRDFFRDSKWGQYGCPFILEWPYEDIPYMLKTKITEQYLKESK